ncbi:hypothetical protein HHO41_14245 [Bacillus sp. DNRA2]|uniref:YczE/YyaS/YitT family protein n=1 Tax=Bacillus sp. DNRA2 TaxID=2723053 RepID=UPI00145D97D2|nr:hypothetical protein [Bacillus sp. DNRA2]NMD71463.1 hypothetical protein [Bacillus sp. DNRA2]
MKYFLTRLLRLIFGLFLYSLGIVITMNANIGYAPWDVLHVGLAKTIGMSIGNVSIIAGVLIGVVTVLFGEKLGVGTILNMVLIGLFLDMLISIDIIPVASNYVFGILMVLVGLYIIALASYFYIGSGFGAGPRDSLMVALTRKTGLPVGICRGTIEFLAVIIGWKLGGMVGFGTIISAFMIGFCVQTTFKMLKFDPTKVEHETMDHTFNFLFSNKSELKQLEKHKDNTTSL